MDGISELLHLAEVMIGPQLGFPMQETASQRLYVVGPYRWRGRFARQEMPTSRDFPRERSPPGISRCTAKAYRCENSVWHSPFLCSRKAGLVVVVRKKRRKLSPQQRHTPVRSPPFSPRRTDLPRRTAGGCVAFAGERTISWLQAFRRLITRHEFYAFLYHSFAKIACIMSVLRRF